jgi:hypothetical protein
VQPDGIGQIGQGFLVKAFPGLLEAGSPWAMGRETEPPSCFAGRVAQQSAQALSKPLAQAAFGCHVISPFW